MPTYISYGRYSRDAMRGMLAHPEDRTGPVSRLYESCGGRLINYFVTPGCEFDWMVLAEAPNEESMLAVVLIVTGTGGVANIRTARALTGPEAMQMLQKSSGAARSFKSAGHAAPSGQTA
jgi:uncharacterized protein with GYD domain